MKSGFRLFELKKTLSPTSLIKVAEKLGVSLSRVKQFTAEKRLPATKVGNTNLVREEDLSLVQERQNGRLPKGKDSQNDA